MEKPDAAFCRNAMGLRGRKSTCKKCGNGRSQEGYYRNLEANRKRNRLGIKKRRRQVPAMLMLGHAKRRAKDKGLPFSITEKDLVIPKVCPVLGIPIKKKKGCGPSDNSPSLDRLVPKLGYVPGNVAVISNRANRIKSDATPDELHAVADWYEGVLQSRTFMH